MKNILTNLLGIVCIAGATCVSSESFAGLVLGNGTVGGSVVGSFNYYPDPTGPDSTFHEYSEDNNQSFNLLDGPFSEEIVYAEDSSSDGNASLAGRSTASLSMDRSGDTHTFNGRVEASLLWLTGSTANIFPRSRYSSVFLSYNFTLDTSHDFLFGESGRFSDGLGSLLGVSLTNLDTQDIICRDDLRSGDDTCDHRIGTIDSGAYNITISADISNNDQPISPPSSSSVNSFLLSLTDRGDTSSTVPAPASVFLLLGGLALLRLNNRFL